MLNEKSKARLLEIARRSVEAAVRRQPRPAFKETDAALTGKQGAFVTLKNGDELRGCLGNFVSDRPLFELVCDMATASATEDPRFFGNPIRPAELSEISIEISVLSPLEKIANPLDIELGKHGIYIQRGWASGCFLPQVATETGWTKEEFLSHCCAGKAGLSANAWRQPDTDVYVFTAEVFGEEEKA
jgi:AmmeMemoRadiSam system protein A